MDLKKSDVVEERVRESCSAEGKVKGKVKSVSRESVSETTDRVSREFRESKKSEMHIVGSIPCV